MKRIYLMIMLMLVLVLPACGKKENTEEKLNVLSSEAHPYEYSCQAQEDGSLLFIINGQWSGKWSAYSTMEDIIGVQAKDQSDTQASFTLKAMNDIGGYSEVLLTQEDGKEVPVTIAVTVISDEEDGLQIGSIQVLEEDALQEETVSDNSAQQEEAPSSREQIISALGGIEMKVPAQLSVTHVSDGQWETEEGPKPYAQMEFAYEGTPMMALLAKDVSLTEFEKVLVDEDVEKEVITEGDTETWILPVDGGTITMWKGSDEIRYVVIDRKENSDSGQKIKALFEK